MAAYLIGFVLGWGACVLFYTALMAWRPQWILGKGEQ